MITTRELDVTQPFTRAQARAAGLTDGQLRGHDFVRLFRNVLIARGLPVSLYTRARGALLVAPGSAFISHDTAAGLWGGSGPESSDVHVTISRQHSLHISVSGHISRIGPGQRRG